MLALQKRVDQLEKLVDILALHTGKTLEEFMEEMAGVETTPGASIFIARR